VSFLGRLIDIFAPRPAIPEAAPPVPEGKMRLHLFCGHFFSEAEAEAYCYDAPDHNHPEPLTRDLPGAYIDPAFVEIGFAADIPNRLAEFFDPDGVAERLVEIGNCNTLVMIAEDAFGGFPYSLNNTPVLAYLGAFVVHR
jgi:hypothetical protein